MSSRRAAAFVKRLMQVAAMAPANFAAGAVFLISELLKARVPTLLRARTPASNVHMI